MNSEHAAIRQILGLEERVYNQLFERRCLSVDDRWSDASAAESAMQILYAYFDAPLIFLGTRVSRAFGVIFEPFVVAIADPWALCFPHPSDPFFDSTTHMQARDSLADLYPSYAALAGEKKRRDAKRLGLG